MNGRRFDGGPAFPTTWENFSDMNVTAPDHTVVPPGATVTMSGMSLRDHFAGQALIGVLTMVSTGSHDAASTPEGCAREAYLLADAMLLERAR